MTDCQLDLHGPDVDLHSGSFGGAVPNPLHVMADLLAGLHDDDGRVTRVRLTAEGEARLASLAQAHLDELRSLAPVIAAQLESSRSTCRVS